MAGGGTGGGGAALDNGVVMRVVSLASQRENLEYFLRVFKVYNLD